MESNQLSRFERVFLANVPGVPNIHAAGARLTLSTKMKGHSLWNVHGYDGTFVGVMHRHSLVDFSEFQWPFFSL